MAAKTTPLGDRLFFVDSLRGVAAMLVLLFHLYNAVSPARELLVPDVLHEMLQLGEGGVQVFFVLSGFVIASALERLPVLNVRVLGRFMLRRSIRLDPPYWLLIALNAIFLLTLSSTHKDVDAGVVVANMFYVNDMLALPFMVPVGWTLAFEVQLYVMLALACLLSAATRKSNAVVDVGVRALVYVPLLVVSVMFAMNTIPVRSSPWALSAWHMFFLGVTSWWVASKRNGAWGFFLLALASSTAVFAATHEVVTLLSVGTAVTLAMAAARGKLSHAVGGRPLQWLGKISYSLYLVHPLVGNKTLRMIEPRIAAISSDVAEQLARWSAFGFGIALSLGAAWLLWRFVERPTHAWSRGVALVPRG